VAYLPSWILYYPIARYTHITRSPTRKLSLSLFGFLTSCAIMKTSLFWSASLFASAFAFPASLLNKDISDDQLAEITALAAKVKAEIQSNETRGNVKRLGFNADAQRVDTTGQWEYVRISPLMKQNLE
jgi:hypothetical protein